MLRTLKRLVIEEQGMEMVEWAIVGVVFAVASALVWSELKDSIDTGLGKIETTVETGTAPTG